MVSSMADRSISSLRSVMGWAMAKLDVQSRAIIPARNKVGKDVIIYNRMIFMGSPCVVRMAIQREILNSVGIRENGKLDIGFEN